ncbi:hypothetical protein AB4455_06500 [Vibrio sp. 10N.261.46.E12]|uniref:hypothetical protein n=1 Tax=unclassified Vibrio TaxID=2614977 RepID=UPI0009764EAD|nr:MULTISPECIES: hypothetical protein [unclassified Vibrio]OMO37190.1 hypothetical protein BH584_23780 [Vibrio sp. 10N.261.45.E1]PMJ25777.1 hypothetical protein BCU27_09955 [Vibrio sp. 10N.286.45.B6]PML84428.1 hypothetical protein BCT66_17435 [Vibrio sp. 10N.261.49.E11]PMM90184.1 hypothetical protein BCT46_23750 [Vibrio sp. 10N.261.46.E8]PMN46147.1 hypothetical protein BCT32_11170 [Vibrio sp. 10N.261.45.E11]
MDILNQLAQSSQKTISKHDDPSLQSLDEKRQSSEKTAILEDHKAVFSSVKNVLNNRHESIDLIDLLSEIGINGIDDIVAAGGFKEGFEYKFELGDETFICDLKEFRGKAEIERHTTISKENAREGQLNKDNLGDLYDKIVFSGGNVQPGFANAGENDIAEVLDGQRRRASCIIHGDLVYKVFVSRTKMTPQQARKLARIIQETSKPLSALQKGRELHRVFTLEKFSTLKATNDNEELAKGPKPLSLYNWLGRLPEELVMFVNAHIDVDIHSLRDSNFEELKKSLTKLNDKASDEQGVVESLAVVKANTLEPSHDNTLTYETSLKEAYKRLWSQAEPIVESEVDTYLESNDVKGAALGHKKLFELIKTSLTKAWVETSAIEGKSKPKPQYFDVDPNETRKPSFLKSGTLKKPKLTLELAGYTEDEIDEALKVLQDHFSKKQ